LFRDELPWLPEAALCWRRLPDILGHFALLPSTTDRKPERAKDAPFMSVPLAHGSPEWIPGVLPTRLCPPATIALRGYV
jgi:hypothetical protein